MWIAAVAVCGLLGLCLAEEYRPSYPQPEGKSHYPEPSHAGSAAYRQSVEADYSAVHVNDLLESIEKKISVINRNKYSQRVEADYAAAQLDDLMEGIERLHDRKRQLKDRIGYLKSTTGKNRAFQYKYETIVSADVNEEIEEQNEQLYDLAGKIAKIQDIKSQVSKLQYLAQKIRNSTEDTVAADTESLRTLADSQAQDIVEDINKTYQTALLVARDLQVVADRIENSSRLLTTVKLEVEKVAARSEYSTAQATSVTITLDSQGIGNATLSYPGFPEEYSGFLTGLNHIRRSGNYGATNVRDAIDQYVIFASPGEGEINVLALGETLFGKFDVSFLGFSFIGKQVN